MKSLFRKSMARSCGSSGSRGRGSRGQVMVLAAGGIILLLAMAGLAVDVGLLWATDHQMRAATDAAAKAAAEEILSGNPDTLSTAGKHDASLNGFTDGANGVTVTINNPPKGGPFVGDKEYAEAIITQTVPTYFLRAVNISSVPITTRASARIFSAPDCIFTIDGTNFRHELTIGQNNNGAVLTGTTCTIFTNSTSVDPISTHNGGCTNMKAIFNVGGFIDDGDCVEPIPKQGQPPVTDPLAYMTEPTAGACDHTNFVQSATAVLSPGTYCGDATHPAIKLSGNVKYTFNPGLYILNGGGMVANLTGTSAVPGSAPDPSDPKHPCNGTTGPNLQGTGGVSFYNTGSATRPLKAINVEAASTTVLTAPTSAPDEGILFFEDRTLGSNGTPTEMVGCGTYTGTFYFPNTTLIFAGTGSAAYNNLLAFHMTIADTYTIGTNYSSLDHGGPFKIGAGLAE